MTQIVLEVIQIVLVLLGVLSAGLAIWASMLVFISFADRLLRWFD